MDVENGEVTKACLDRLVDEIVMKLVATGCEDVIDAVTEFYHAVGDRLNVLSSEDSKKWPTYPKGAPQQYPSQKDVNVRVFAALTADFVSPGALARSMEIPREMVGKAVRKFVKEGSVIEHPWSMKVRLRQSAADRWYLDPKTGALVR